MHHLAIIKPVDYLVIGHITQDLHPSGPTLGGTVSFAALTARAAGLRVGIVTSCASDMIMPELDGIQIINHPSEYTTTFENIYTPSGRIQIIHHRAGMLDYSMIPDSWRNTPVVHLGPLDAELDPNLVRSFPNSFVGLTPQGWLRTWDARGHVHLGEWPEAGFVLEHSSAAVLSIEDVAGDEKRIDEMLASIRILAVTEGAAGVRIYWNGDLRHFSPPFVEEVDPVGAGDIFAAAFFIRLQSTRDPWEAARFANQIAAISVTRPGILGVPTPAEFQSSLVEIFQ